MGPNDVLMQLLTAPFPQMMLSSIAILVISYLLLTLMKIRNPKIRGFFYSLTLIAPIVVYLFYMPSVWVMRPVLEHGSFGGPSFVISQVGPMVGEGITSIMVASPGFATIVGGQEAASLSYTGLLCIIGLVFGVATLAVSYFFGVKIVKRCQGVMDVTAEDEPRLYKSVEKLASSRLGVATPKIGLTESLQPNAFTIGYGDNAMVVFSSGLISTLNMVELEAVIAHELAHIKNRDFHLMAIVSSLKIVSFFNPAAYLSASLLAREREYLADDVGSKATGRKNTLKRALIKIAAVPMQRRAVIPELVSGIFIYSQIGSLKAAFTSHPSLDMRLDRIGREKVGGKMDGYKAAVVAVLLVCSLVMLSSYIMQPMHLVDMFFGFGPGFRVPMGGIKLAPVWGGGDMQTFTFSTRSFGFEYARAPPDGLALRQIIVL